MNHLIRHNIQNGDAAILGAKAQAVPNQSHPVPGLALRPGLRLGLAFSGRGKVPLIAVVAEVGTVKGAQCA